MLSQMKKASSMTPKAPICDVFERPDDQVSSRKEKTGNYSRPHRCPSPDIDLYKSPPPIFHSDVKIDNFGLLRYIFVDFIPCYELFVGLFKKDSTAKSCMSLNSKSDFCSLF